MKLKQIKSLKHRILINISILLVIALLVSTGLAYVYFINTTREEIVEEYKRRTNQLSSQIELMSEDIISFSKNIAVDSVIQGSIQQHDFENVFARVKNQKAVNDKLKFYNMLRQYIATTTIISPNELNYNSRAFYDDNYLYSKKLDTTYKTYLLSEELIFSGAYKAIEAEIKGDLICYKISIKNIDRPRETIGVLVIEIYKSYFEKVLIDNQEGYEAFEWIDQSNDLMYQKGTNKAPMISYKDFEKGQSIIVKKTKGGYVIGELIPNSKWILSGFISNHTINQKTMYGSYFLVLFFITSLSLIVIMMNSVLSNMINPITELTKTMEKVGNENLDIKVYIDSGDEIEKLYKGFNRMIINIKQHMENQLNHEKQIKDMEFDIMLAQINPHYLYNVLNTIVYKATADHNEDIAHIASSLIRIMQESLKVGEKSIYTTLEKEIEIVKSYLKIQEYRYPDIFNIYYSIDETLMQCEIPKTIIQPIIENAIFHGISQKGEQGNIYLDIYQKDGDLIIKIKDDGIGMTKEIIEKFMNGEQLNFNKEDRKHIGIVNIRDRINYLYLNKASMNVESILNKYTIFTITLPLKHNNI